MLTFPSSVIAMQCNDPTARKRFSFISNIAQSALISSLAKLFMFCQSLSNETNVSRRLRRYRTMTLGRFIASMRDGSAIPVLSNCSLTGLLSQLDSAAY